MFIFKNKSFFSCKNIPIGIFLYRQSNTAMSKAEKTRQFIIEKTAPIFNTKGVAGTSIQDMIEATGLTKGSIYGNFKNKDEVAIAVFQYHLQKMRSVIDSAIDSKANSREKLLCYPDIYAQFLYNSLPDGGCAILNTAVEADDTHPLLKEYANHAVMSWKEKIINIIENGIATGELKKSNHAEAIALQIIATIEGAIMVTKLTGKSNYHQSLMDTLRQTINQL